MNLVNPIPCLGLLGSIALAVYATIPDVRSVKVAHRLTTGRAIAAVSVPMPIVSLILPCCPGAVATLLG